MDHASPFAAPPVAASQPVAHPLVRARVTGRVAGLALGAAAVAALAVLSLGLGAADLDVPSVIRAFAAPDGSSAHLIVTEIRLPRMLVALVVGIALGLSGVVMQGVTHNPVADPGFLGINAGAALAVALGILVGVAQPGGYVWFALAGAAVATVVVALLGSVGRGRPSPVRLALAGAVVAALCSAVTSTILVVDDSTLDRFRFWNVGSLAGRGYDDLAAIVPFVVAGTVVALALGRSINGLALGDDLAASLGQRVQATRAAAGLAIVLLAGASVAAAGPIAFAGLAVAHVARILTGNDYRWALAYALVLGPALLLVADLVGRVVARPSELEVGIVTALVGAPILVWLVRRRGGLERTAS
ncbi:MAG TPA: iron ABC transporter permease [Candidatus Limnocylindrales bacterium]|nr:iron ABC transporter permease [Candidatus Limnocylindrales bacterium]